MRANRIVFEPAPDAQGQDDDQPPVPDRSSDLDHHEEPAYALADPSPPDETRPRGTTVYMKDGPQVILTTREAAALLTVSPSMLQRFRVKGGGPRYLQIGGAVRYARVDLLEWVLTMRRGGTPEG
ncbi:MAG: helix-turn-helix domain-containing protein [bacterium]|nr:helix-turn-helix domain-containing protein [bacterium]